MPNPHVSVVIASWNAERFILRAINSALQQENCGNVEIVVIDDCSTDQTMEKLEDISARFGNIRFARTGINSGPAAARNAGIAMARGDWIAILDADDAFAVGRLARLVSVANENDLDAIADLPVFFDLAADKESPTQLTATGELSVLDLRDLLVGDVSSGLDLGLLKPVFRSSLFSSAGLKYREDIRHGEDHRLYIDWVRAGVRFGFIREARYLFSTRIGEISGVYSPGSVTKVNYRAVARQTLDLRRELEGAGDLSEDVDFAIRSKIEAALRNNRIYGWTALRKKNWSRLRSWLLDDCRNVGELLLIVVKKMLGQRGLPD